MATGKKATKNDRRGVVGLLVVDSYTRIPDVQNYSGEHSAGVVNFASVLVKGSLVPLRPPKGPSNLTVIGVALALEEET